MDITTFNKVIGRQMNIIDCVDNNFFLKKIFPDGVSEALVGQFGLDQGRFSLTLHTRSKPATETPKWGIWGKNYDVIAFEMLGGGIGEIEVHNWDAFDFAAINCEMNNNKIVIEVTGSNWSFKLSCTVLVFQRSSTYIG